MLPIIQGCVEEFIRTTYGPEAFASISEALGGETCFHQTGQEDDTRFLRLIHACVEVLGRSLDDITRELGRFALRAASAAGYGKLLASFSTNIIGTLSMQNNFNSQLALAIPSYQWPDFRVEKVTATSLELHYRSSRPNLGGMVEGVIQGLASDFHGGQQIDMKLLRGRADGSADHEVWAVTYPPQTAVIEVKARDAAAAEASVFAMDAPTFYRLHPFHLLLDSSGRVLQAGSVLQRVVPGCKPGVLAEDLFKVMMPYTDATFAGLSAVAGQCCVLQMRCASGMQLKGQWISTRVRRADLQRANSEGGGARPRGPTPLLVSEASEGSLNAEHHAASAPKPSLGALSAAIGHTANGASPLAKILMCQAGTNAANAAMSPGFGDKFRARPLKLKPAGSYSPASSPVESRRGSLLMSQCPVLPPLVASPLEIGVVGKNSAAGKASAVGSPVSNGHAAAAADVCNSNGSFTHQPGIQPKKNSGSPVRTSIPGFPPCSNGADSYGYCSSGNGNNVDNSNPWVEVLLFMGSPRVTKLSELGAMGLYLEDIPFHDMSTDLVVLAEQREMEAAAHARLEKANAALEARAQLLAEQAERTEAANERLEEALHEALAARDGELASGLMDHTGSMVTVESPIEKVLRLLDSLLYGAEVPMSEVLSVRDAVLSAGRDLMIPANAQDQVAAGLGGAGLGDDEVQAALRQMLWAEDGELGISDALLEGSSQDDSGDESLVDNLGLIAARNASRVLPGSQMGHVPIPSSGLQLGSQENVPSTVVAGQSGYARSNQRLPTMMLIDMDGGSELPVAAARPRTAGGARGLGETDTSPAPSVNMRPRTAGGARLTPDKVRFGALEPPGPSEGQAQEQHSQQDQTPQQPSNQPQQPVPQQQPHPPQSPPQGAGHTQLPPGITLLSPRTSKLSGDNNSIHSVSDSQFSLPSVLPALDAELAASTPSLAVGGASGLLRARAMTTSTGTPMSIDMYNLLKVANDSNASSQQQGSVTTGSNPALMRSRSARRALRRSMSRYDVISMEAADLLKPPTDPVARVLAKVDGWRFDTWELAEVTSGRPLSMLGYALLQRSGLISRFKLSDVRLARWLIAIEDGYKDNPYHNSVHAADVLRTMHFIMTRGGVAAKLGTFKDLGLLAAYTASVVHDYEHKGLNNDFLIKSGDELALRYNDRSPMENHHVAAAWGLMRTDNMNAFVHTPTKAREALRRLVIELVLATDMKQHFTFSSLFNTKLPALLELAGHHPSRTPITGIVQPSASRPATRPSTSKSTLSRAPSKRLTQQSAGKPTPTISMGAAVTVAQAVTAFKRLVGHTKHKDTFEESEITDEDQRILVMQVAMKCADLGHLAHDKVVHKRWVAALEEELFRQGDAEKAAGLPVSPLMDRAGRAGVSKGQAGFYSVVVLPQLQAFCRVFPSVVPMLECAYDNFRMWKTEGA